jgi:hypothetical protein
MKTGLKTFTLWLPVWIFLVYATLIWRSSQLCAAETSFRPSLAVSEEMTDNFFEQSNNKLSEYTTRITPGAVLRYQSPFWTWDTSYAFEYRYYAMDNKGDEYNHTGALKGAVTLLDNFLLLDLSNTFHRVTLDVARNAATESSLFLNQTDQNTAIISPYFLWRLRGDSSLKTGYRFTDTRYWDAAGIEKQEHGGFADLSHAVTAKLSLTGSYAFTRLESLPSSFNKHDLSGGFKYEYADKSFISAQFGNSWQLFSDGRDVSYPFWSAALTHNFNVAVVTLETKSASTENPLSVSTKENSYSLKLDKLLDRGALGLAATYSEFFNTATDVMEQHKIGLSATGRYEVLQNLSANISANGEHFGSSTATTTATTSYPYRFTCSAGASYLLNNDLTLGVTYTYIVQRSDLDSAAGANEINKGVVEVKKLF